MPRCVAPPPSVFHMRALTVENLRVSFTSRARGLDVRATATPARSKRTAPEVSVRAFGVSV